MSGFQIYLLVDQDSFFALNIDIPSYGIVLPNFAGSASDWL